MQLSHCITYGVCIFLHHFKSLKVVMCIFLLIHTIHDRFVTNNIATKRVNVSIYLSIGISTTTAFPEGAFEPVPWHL